MEEGRGRRRLNPALVLFFLSPMVAELLTGSAPPAEFFNPFVFLILCALYGSGAVLVHELVVHWRKGWPSILMLGLAYGIVEEGLMVKSFFDPAWVDLGLLGTYGRWGGVNVVWSVGLALFHAVWSIAIPILIVEGLFPERAGSPWIQRRSFRLLAGLLAADVVFGFLFLTPYRPPLVPYLLAATAVIGFGLLARRMPASWAVSPTPGPGDDRRGGFRFWLAGLGATLAFFALLWGVPNTHVPPVLAILLLVLLAGGVVAGLRRMLSPTRWQAVRALALAAGALTFFVLLAPLQQLDTTRADNPAGMALVGLAGAAFLVWLWRRAARRSVSGIPAAGAPETNPTP